MTAAVGIPLILAVTWLGGWWFAITCGAIALLASIEFGHGWLFPSLPISRAGPQLTTFSLPAVMVAGAHGDTRFIGAGLVFALLSAGAGYLPIRAVGPRKPWRVLAWCIVYIGIGVVSLVLIRDLSEGREWFLLALLPVFAVDTGAYATGRTIGRHKLAPRISPKKTWEGAIGGYVAGVVAFLAANSLLSTGHGTTTMAPFALAMPILAQAGDLLESGMKRRMGVKDASGLLPGHGGFMDRLDSIVLVAPAFYVFLRLAVL
ncbi:MAG: phosphatidate cytidylyltransferase [Dehalococcoidia bacterium]|nr:phosphatidate cytidylyltransferase [Dehalococcoidia bacterium]